MGQVAGVTAQQPPQSPHGPLQTAEVMAQAPPQMHQEMGSEPPHIPQKASYEPSQLHPNPSQPSEITAMASHQHAQFQLQHDPQHNPLQPSQMTGANAPHQHSQFQFQHNPFQIATAMAPPQPSQLSRKRPRLEGLIENNAG